MASFYPSIGKWYQDSTSQQLFEVIAVDERNGRIEVELEDGCIDEYDMENWKKLDVHPASAPKNMNAGYGLPPVNDGWSGEIDLSSGGMNNPLEFMEGESFLGDFDDF